MAATTTGGVASTRTISRMNQQAIVRVLQEQGPLSRVEIGVLTGLSPATVNRLTTALVRARILEADGTQPTGGRPSMILRYTGGPRVVAAIQLRADRVLGALVDLAGVPVTRAEREFPEDGAVAGTSPRLDTLTSLLETLLDEARRRRLECLRVAVSVPGVVSEPDGVIGAVPELGWPSVRLRASLAAVTSLPLTIENDANALVFGEHRRGAAVGCDSAVAVLLDNGMGAGIITRGQLHRGRHSEAGEIGYLLMERSSLRRSYRDLGDLEDRVGSVALTRAATARGLTGAEHDPITARRISQLAAEGDPVAAEMRDEILDMVSMAIAALSVILDPDVIVVGGGVGSDLAATVAEIEQRLTGRILRVPSLAPSVLGADGVLLGVAELALAQVDLASIGAG